MATYFYVLTVVILMTVIQCIQSLPPLIFAPGYGGSELYATINSNDEVPAPCRDVHGVLVGQPFPPYRLTKQDCVWALLTTPSPKGVSISVKDFGGFGGIMQNYWSVIKSFSDIGYEVNKNLFGAPYDYRWMSPNALVSITSFVSDMQILVEQAYRQNGNTRVMIMGHSNGPPTLYSFLSGMPKEWKDTYIAGFISLSGNFLGQMNAFGTFLDTANDGALEMAASWESNYMSASWGDYAGLKGIPLVTTYSGTPQEKNYTTSLTDMTELFASANHEDWAARLASLYPVMDRTQDPDTDMYCFYGSEVQTVYSYVFKEGILNARPIAKRSMNGDDNQDIMDNSFCEIWGDSLTKAGHRFQAQAFPGVGHMQMVTDDKVVAEIKKVLLSY